MANLLSTIPSDALALNFMMPGQSREFPDGWVHRKIEPCTIIAQVLFGHYEITCNGRTEVIRPGEAFLTPAHRPMTIVHHGDPMRGNLMGARWNHFHFTLYDTLDLTALLELPLKLKANEAERLGQIIHELLINDLIDDRQGLQGLARRHALAFETLQVICQIAPLREESHAILQQSPRLASVFAHIREHMAEPIGPAHLARLTHMSLSRFHAYFRGHMGCTPMEYVKRLRLQEACKLLLAGDEPVARVAERVGFSNQFHFSREFKARFDMTPSRYRQAHSPMLV